VVKEKKASKDIMIMNPEDNVAICLRELKAGEELSVEHGHHKIQLKALDPIPLGHKISLMAIKKGNPIVKYGEVIGKAKEDILVGQHVHVHNISDY
jgi:altronate dehydratase small subunit